LIPLGSYFDSPQAGHSWPAFFSRTDIKPVADIWITSYVYLFQVKYFKAVCFLSKTKAAE
jgi:hypothetical protein